MSTIFSSETPAQAEANFVPPTAPIKNSKQVQRETNNSELLDSDSDEHNSDEQEPLLYRLHRAFGPLAGAMILDTADFVTFGPIGIVLGLFVGATTAWWISSIYEYAPRTRAIWAGIAGLYCMMPLTALLPLATLMSTVGRLRDKG